MAAMRRLTVAQQWSSPGRVHLENRVDRTEDRLGARINDRAEDRTRDKTEDRT